MRLDQMRLVTAIVDEIERQIADAPVVDRQFNAIIDAANAIVREFSIGEIASRPGEGIAAWRKTDQVGASSDYMAAKLGEAGIRDYAHPRDPSDFGRCLTLLAAAPELREALPLMADESPEWAGLVAHWDELENLYQEELPSGHAPKTYTRMREIMDSARSQATAVKEGE